MAARGKLTRVVGALGATLAALSVAAAAYASHAAAPDARERLFIAAAFAFGHGLALLVLPAVVSGRLASTGIGMLTAGAVLFAGSLAGAALAGLGTQLAPTGGLSMIAGWCLLAIARARGS